jgi:hypothetical protein
MLFYDRRKGKDRRSKKDRRGFDNPDYNGPENRSKIERRNNKDRRHHADRRSGVYHKLSNQRKTLLDDVLNKLEDLLEEEI